MMRRPAASRRAAAATTSITINAGTSLRADALTPTLPGSASPGGGGWGTAKRLALSRMTAPAEAGRFRPLQRHHMAELPAPLVAAAVPLPPPLLDWYCH